MGSSDKVVSRIAVRVNELASDFDKYVKVFAESNRFTGPSWYFHNRTIELTTKTRSLDDLFNNDCFFEYLYATLTSWGLHRMGPGNAKLRELDEIKESFRLKLPAISELSKMSLSQLPKQNVREVAGKAWEVMSGLKVSIAEAQIVANSKALHHIIPQLIAPVDREYTFNFFYSRKNLSIPEEHAFIEIFTAMTDIARQNAEAISRLVGTIWNTSESKIVDNAIVGFMISKAAPNKAIRPTS